MSKAAKGIDVEALKGQGRREVPPGIAGQGLPVPALDFLEVGLVARRLPMGEESLVGVVLWGRFAGWFQGRFQGRFQGC